MPSAIAQEPGGQAMTELHFKPAVELAAMVRDKRIGCLELLEHFLDRVERYNPKLNAIIWMDEEVARTRARAADAALARGEIWGPLHGVPMTIKESYNVAGSPTTWGAPQYKDNVTDGNALAVDRLLEAGVVLFGKTNVPIYLADWQSFNVIYGTTNNPWDVSRTPGGSSGGSAAALAAGLTGIEAGSDIGASIRNPAHYCGVFGHKPTYGIIPGRGHALPGVAVMSDISACGPLARSAEDLAVALDIMAGPDVLDGAGWRLELPAPRKTKLSDFRVAVKLSDPNAEVDAAYADRLQAVVDAVAKSGATVAEAEPKLDTIRAHEVYILLLRTATSARTPPAQLERFQEVLQDLGPEDPSYLGRMARAAFMPHREWLPLNNERAIMRLKWAEFFQDWDVLLCPAAASAAWPHDQEGERHERTITVNGHQVPTTDQLFWAGYPGVVYLPAAVAPSGLTRDGLPTGIQVISAHLQDRTAIEFCRLLEQEIGGFQPPPGY